MLHTKILTAIALTAGIAAIPASAFTVISTPTDEYRDQTFLIGVPGNGGPRTVWGDINLTVAFSTALAPRTVGLNWATWGTPPDTEQSAPRVWFTLGGTDVTFTFSPVSPSDVVTTWGFEAQPNPFAVLDITVEFFKGEQLVGSITRAVDGNAGARLFAATAAPGTWFTHVRIFSESDFAVAQLRYGLGIVPEPATWALMIAGFGMVGFAARRRRVARIAA
jgi:hypothetical protein